MLQSMNQTQSCQLAYAFQKQVWGPGIDFASQSCCWNGKLSCGCQIKRRAASVSSWKLRAQTNATVTLHQISPVFFIHWVLFLYLLYIFYQRISSTSLLWNFGGLIMPKLDKLPFRIFFFFFPSFLFFQQAVLSGITHSRMYFQQPK